MILPIVTYGNSILKKKAEPIASDYPDLRQLVDDMFETMYKASGVGLAGPQINRSIRLFVIDADDFKEKYPEAEGFKKVFINPEILELSGEEWSFYEGCLSLPNMGENVVRPSKVKIRYQDLDFNTYEEEYDGIRARVIQHEYDHLEGLVYVDRISSMKKLLLKKKLNNIIDGITRPDYKILIPKKRK